MSGPDAARDLADAAGLDPEAYAERVSSAGPEAFVELITYRQSDPDGQELATATEGIPGAVALEDEQVLGPTRTFAQPLLGTVGPVTAELLEEEPDRYAAGDVVGLTGLQAAFDGAVRRPWSAPWTSTRAAPPWSWSRRRCRVRNCGSP